MYVILAPACPGTPEVLKYDGLAYKGEFVVENRKGWFALVASLWSNIYTFPLINVKLNVGLPSITNLLLPLELPHRMR